MLPLVAFPTGDGPFLADHYAMGLTTQLGNRLVVTASRLLPQGDRLSAETWSSRHRTILGLVWLQAAALAGFAVFQGFSFSHGLLEGTAVAAAPALAEAARLRSRTVRATAASVGLITSAAVLTHLSRGHIEAHFHFFIMLSVIALYQSWVPFLLSIAYVVVHHGVVGTIEPESVYNHPGAVSEPWIWALVHAVAVAAACVVYIISWRWNEAALGERNDAVKAVEASAELMSSTMESTADGILVVDRDGRVAYTNRRFAEMWRIPPDLVQLRDDERLLNFVLDQLAEPEVFLEKVRELYGSEDEDLDTLVFKDGREFERYSRPLLTGNLVSGRVWSFRDVTARRRSEQQLVHLANHDPLTGLLNRRRLDEEIERMLGEVRRYGVEAALLFLDLDQFKDVNDSRGHRAGDDLLKAVAKILLTRSRSTDHVSRLGGDEFAVLLSHTSEQEAARVSQDLLETIRTHVFTGGGEPIRMTASAGLTPIDPTSENAGDVLARADLAMYKAKEDGRNRLAIFAANADWQAQITSRIGWQQRVREALERDLFELYAQPILDLRLGRISRYELLLRMKQSGTQEMVLPGTFLEVAERSGLIQDVDRWVVKKAIRTLGEFQARGQFVHLEVNLSGKAFSDPSLLDVIESELAAHGVDASRLVLEVTETAAISSLDEARSFIGQLKRIGCEFALDDFGVGFSSFSHLKHLPVEYLKIDGSFVRDLVRDTVDQHLVRSIVSIAKALGKQTIAEFVEDAETVALLREYGVDYAQGYFVGEPAALRQSDRRQAA